MPKATDTLQIAIAFDQHYLQQFFALLSSIFANNADVCFNIHCIATGIEPSVKKDTELYVGEHQSVIFFYSVDEALLANLVIRSNWTQAVYYRLFFPFLVPEQVCRLLYLDTDIVVVGNLTELYSLPMQNFPVAAVYDNYVRKQPLIGIDEEGEYFNSGVLLIDVGLWKQHRVTERAIEYLQRNPDRIKFVDQCALNAVLVGNWKKLDYRFNVMYSYVPSDASLQELKKFIQDKVVVHYTLQRPWNFLCKNRLRYLYHSYLSASPLANQDSRYTDFRIEDIPQWLMLRATEFYLDAVVVRKAWRWTKNIFNT